MKNKIMFLVALLAIVASMSFMIIGSSITVATAQQTTSTMEGSEGQTNATLLETLLQFFYQEKQFQQKVSYTYMIVHLMQ
jgi:zona occludens toxin (predicted ATPase)